MRTNDLRVAIVFVWFEQDFQMVLKDKGFWILQLTGWLLFAYLVYAQAIPAFDYDLGIAMGTQEPAGTITDVGVAFFWGYAFADVVSYIPLLALGLIGHALHKTWGRVALAGALGITIYWPITALAAVVFAQDAPGWNLPIPLEYWIVLSGLVVWGCWGLWRLCLEFNAKH